MADTILFKQLYAKNTETSTKTPIYPVNQKDFVIVTSLDCSIAGGAAFTWQAPATGSTNYTLLKNDAVVTAKEDIELYFETVINTKCLPSAFIPTYVLNTSTGEFCKLVSTQIDTNYKLEYTVVDTGILTSVLTTLESINNRLIALSDLDSISVSDMTTEYTVGDAFSFDGICTAHYSDSSTAVIPTASLVVIMEGDTSTTGTKEVRVSYTKGTTTKTVTYDIEVTAAEVTPAE